MRTFPSCSSKLWIPTPPLNIPHFSKTTYSSSSFYNLYNLYNHFTTAVVSSKDQSPEAVSVALARLKQLEGRPIRYTDDAYN